MIFILNREGTVTETVTSPVYQGSNANEVVVLAPFAPTNTVTVGFTLPNGLIVQPKLTDSGKGATMTSLPVKDLSLKVGETYEDMSAWYCKLDRDITRYSGTLTMQFFLYDAAGDILASSSTTVPVQKGVPVLDGTTFDASTAAQLQKALDEVYAMISSLNEELRTVKETTEQNGEMISVLQNDVSQNTTAITNIEAQVKEADASITNLESRISANEQNIDGLLGTTSELSQVVSGLDGDTKQLKSEIDALDVRMYDAEDSIIAVRDRVAENEKSITSLGTRMTNAEGNIKDLKSSVSLIWTILGNTIINLTTVEDAYNTRVTAGGLSVVDEAPTTVHKITGASVASANLAAVANQTIASNGVTFTGSATDGTVQMTGSVTEENEYATATVTTGFYLPVGTYTLYAPHKADKVGWHVRNAQSTSIAELNWNGTTTALSFTVSAAGRYHLYVFIPRNAGTLDYTETPMLLRGDRTANLPAFEPYYAGIKSAGFRGITSTGRNLIASLADKTVSADGITAVANPSDGTVTINGRPTTASFNADVSVDFYLPRGTYTIYAPHRTMRFAGWLVKSRKSGATVGKIDWASLGDVVSNTFTVTEPGEYYIRFFVPIGYDYPAFENYVETPMILPGALTENFPAFETYHADTSFALTTPLTLGKWDTIDVDAGKRIAGTVTETQDTPYTEEQLAQFDEYILSADGKTVAYKTETPTETPLSLPKTYRAWHGGCEYITKDAAGGQNTDDLKLTVNQDYYEEVSKA